MAITLALASMLVFLVLEILSWSYISPDNPLWQPKIGIVIQQLVYFKLMLVISAFLFDIYKWCLFISSTG
jgi:hypothetical protein